MAWKAQLANIQLDVYQTRADELKAPPKKAAPSPQQDEQDPVVPVQSTTVSKSAAAAGYEDEVEANGGDYSKHSKSRSSDGRRVTSNGKQASHTPAPSDSRDKSKTNLPEPKAPPVSKTSRKGASSSQPAPKPAAVKTGASAGVPSEAPDRLFRDRKKAITRFQTQEFDVNAFVNSSYKDLSEPSIQSARRELSSVREQCVQQIQRAVHENHGLFLQVTRSIPALDEAVAELRAHVQAGTAVVDALKQAKGLAQQVPAALTHAGSALKAITLGSGKPPKSKMLAQLEEQMHALLAELAVSCASQDLGAAASLLGVGADMLALIDRDTGVLAAEVPDFPIWRGRFEAALSERKRALVSDLVAYLTSPGAERLSPCETRGAAAALSALAGDACATTALLRCHSLKTARLRGRMLHDHAAAGASSEEEGAEFAVALCQRTFLMIGAAADDVAAVWGASTVQVAGTSDISQQEGNPSASPVAAALLGQWAAKEARTAARTLRRQALTPFADSCQLGAMLRCVEVCIVLCATLEVSHGLSVRGPFMAELWFHVSGVLRRVLRTAGEEARVQTGREMTEVIVLAVRTAGASGSPDHPMYQEVLKALELQGLHSSVGLVEQVARMCGDLAPLAAPKLRAVLGPGISAGWASLPGAGTAALRGALGVLPADQAWCLRPVAAALLAHLRELATVHLPRAVLSLGPACGLVVSPAQLVLALKDLESVIDSLPTDPPPAPPPPEDTAALTAAAAAAAAAEVEASAPTDEQQGAAGALGGQEEQEEELGAGDRGRRGRRAAARRARDTLTPEAVTDGWQEEVEVEVDQQDSWWGAGRKPKASTSPRKHQGSQQGWQEESYAGAGQSPRAGRSRAGRSSKAARRSTAELDPGLSSLQVPAEKEAAAAASLSPSGARHGRKGSSGLPPWHEAGGQEEYEQQQHRWRDGEGEQGRQSQAPARPARGALEKGGQQQEQTDVVDADDDAEDFARKLRARAAKRAESRRAAASSTSGAVAPSTALDNSKADAQVSVLQPPTKAAGSKAVVGHSKGKAHVTAPDGSYHLQEGFEQDTLGGQQTDEYGDPEPWSTGMGGGQGQRRPGRQQQQPQKQTAIEGEQRYYGEPEEAQEAWGNTSKSKAGRRSTKDVPVQDQAARPSKWGSTTSFDDDAWGQEAPPQSAAPAEGDESQVQQRQASVVRPRASSPVKPVLAHARAEQQLGSGTSDGYDTGTAPVRRQEANGVDVKPGRSQRLGRGGADASSSWDAEEATILQSGDVRLNGQLSLGRPAHQGTSAQLGSEEEGDGSAEVPGRPAPVAGGDALSRLRARRAAASASAAASSTALDTSTSAAVLPPRTARRSLPLPPPDSEDDEDASPQQQAPLPNSKARAAQPGRTQDAGNIPGTTLASRPPSVPSSRAAKQAPAGEELSLPSARTATGAESSVAALRRSPSPTAKLDGYTGSVNGYPRQNRSHAVGAANADPVGAGDGPQEQQNAGLQAGRLGRHRDRSGALGGDRDVSASIPGSAPPPPAAATAAAAARRARLAALATAAAAGGSSEDEGAPVAPLSLKPPKQSSPPHTRGTAAVDANGLAETEGTKGTAGGRRAALQALAAAAAAGSEDDDEEVPEARPAVARERGARVRTGRAGTEAFGTSSASATVQDAGAVAAGPVGVEEQGSKQVGGGARRDRQAALLAKLQAARANDSDEDDIL